MLKTGWQSEAMQGKRRWLVLGFLLFGLFAWWRYDGEYNERVAKGRALLGIGEFAAAKKAFQEAIDSQPLNKMLGLVAIANERGVKPTQEAAAIFSLSSAARLGLRKASVLVDSKSPQEAASELQQLAAKYPDDGEVAMLQGRFALHWLKLDEAEAHYLLAEKLGPPLAEVAAGLCEIADVRGQDEAALAQCQLAVKRAQQSAGAVPLGYSLNLAGLQVQLNQLDEARQTVSNLPATPEVALMLGRILLFTGQPAPASTLLQQALRDGIDDKTAWYFRGQHMAVFLLKAAEKRCYAGQLLALAQALQGKPEAAADKQPCAVRREAVLDVLAHDVELARRWPANDAAVLAAFRQLFLP